MNHVARCARIAMLALVPLLLGAGATASVSAARPRVSLDWSAVSDKRVELCGLSGLQNMLLQALIEEQFAVVSDTDELGIALRLSEDETGIVVEGRHSGQIRRRRVPFPETCDSTFAIDLQAAVRGVAVELGELPPQVPRGDEAPRTPAPVAEHPQVEKASPAPVEPESSARLQIGAGLQLPGSLYPLAGVRLGVRWHAFPRIVGATILDAMVHAQSELLVMEPTVAVQVAGRVLDGAAVQLEAGLSAGFVAHLFVRDIGFGGHPDARVAVGLTAVFPAYGLTLQLEPHLRLFSVEHVINENRRYTSEPWGLAVYVGVLPGLWSKGGEKLRPSDIE